MTDISAWDHWVHAKSFVRDLEDGLTVEDIIERRKPHLLTGDVVAAVLRKYEVADNSIN